MIRLGAVSLFLGGREILGDVDLTLFPGHKAGIVGGNGAGKTSLLRLIRGELAPDAGVIDIPGEWVLASADQQMPSGQQPIIEYVMDGDEKLRRVEKQLVEAQLSEDGEKEGHLHAEFDALGGYTARSRAAELLDGLGFPPGDIGRPIDDFSGGWRVRLGLARAMFCPADLLLLDEPTNHLDVEAIIWLEEWIRRFQHSILLISHDREFLDRTVSKILHIENGQLTSYSGNYSDFERMRAEKLAQQESMHRRQQREIEHLHRFVERFRAKATKARQAQDRMKKLERMELIAPAHVDSPFHFEFSEPARPPKPVMKLEACAFRYPDSDINILSQTDRTLWPGDRIGLLGPNGAGKSTLIRLLAGALTPSDGAVFHPDNLTIGYFAQDQLDQLDLEATPLLHLQRLKPTESTQKILNFLGGFGFNGERCEEVIRHFSGGEKARLVLAMLVWQTPYLLLLDEPTNHLDLEMRHALTLALQEFSGAVVLVSHDRHLLSTTVDQYWIVNNGEITPFDGSVEDYHQWLLQQRRELDKGHDSASDSQSAVKHSAEARKEKRREEAQLREVTKPLRKEIASLEKKMEKNQARLGELEASLADSSMYETDKKDELQSLLKEQGSLKNELEEFEMAWLDAQERLEMLLSG